MLGLLVAFGVGGCGLSDSDDPRPYRSAAERGPGADKGEEEESETEDDECPSPRACPHGDQIDWERSLIIRDSELLEGFSFKRVMDQIVATSGEPNMTSLELYQRWWDTMNAENERQPLVSSPDDGELARFDQPCDADVLDGQTFFNDYPIECPRIEGILAYTNPFEETIEVDGQEVDNLDAYIPLGLFNRMDLAPSDGSHCGEMRIVFAKNSGTLPRNQFSPPPGGNRNLLIFEAVIPNPNPECGINGCLPLAQEWYKLSKIRNQRALRAQLEKLYFEGFDNFPAAIRADHLGPKGGHVRTNQFMSAVSVDRSTPPQSGPRGFALWQLRDFKLTKNCSGGSCELGIKQLPIDDNPFGNLFSSESNYPQADGFKKQFLEEIPNLAIPGLKTISMDLDAKYLAGESNAPPACLPPGTPGAPPGAQIPDDACYDKHFDPDSQFAQDIQRELDQLGSSVTPTQIVQRADTLSCGGCHQNVENADVGNGEFQSEKPMDFVHISEENPIDGRYHRLSTMMHEMDIPHRLEVMREFMCKGEHLHEDEKKKLEGRPGVDQEFLERRFETLGGPDRVH
ncbi:hypothetical protein FIV42_25810 [Persicimonas caeni]|uniref:Uncharacterized protein n=1 Tax=Persicimonas caeni TaxID=2292766 RepID=A0A4Y6Q0I8_PERCE|nr:hypothetical protein [Persicimonas caeni]QDG54032.1 hypothetical protein FIV42_25810 [Persicimonas caeni]QED35253.1 hypothetical protein FRD00_25805 [Persicimonas caeni]